MQNATQDAVSTIGSVTQSASEMGAFSNEVLQAAVNLLRQAESLRTEIDGFLDTIKTT